MLSTYRPGTSVMTIGHLRGTKTINRTGETIVAKPERCLTPVITGLVESPDAPVRAQAELRTGRDESPVAYLTFNTRGGTLETSLEDYTGLRQPLEGQDPNQAKFRTVGWQGPITRDTDNWSFWSSPVRESGTHPRLPNGRYFQIRVKLMTDALWEFPRMDSLSVEVAPLLASAVRGEVATVADLQPTGNLARVRVGTPTEFVYDIAADFEADSPGFDAVRLLAEGAEFIELQMGNPLEAVEPDEVIAEPSGFAVLLPRAVGEGEPPLRLRFTSTLYGASGTFVGEVFRRDANDLPQVIEAGDATDEVGTNRLQVVADASSLGGVLSSVTVEPATFTPQGDGVNDRARIEYSLLRVSGIDVEVGIYTLGGTPVWRNVQEQSAGAQRVWWDGRDEQGQLVLPGIYLVRVQARSSEGAFERLQRLAVTY